MKDFKEAAEKYADSKDRRLTSYHAGLQEGYQAGYSEAMKEQREFYHLVMTFFNHKDDEHPLTKLQVNIHKHLSSFTEHSR
jgi:flagellar biosynthesis/type III secretory pathway protein FliH